MKAKALFLTLSLIVSAAGSANGSQQSAVRAGARIAVPRIDGNKRTAKVVTPAEITVLKNVVLARGDRPSSIVATKLDDGKVFVGWRISIQAGKNVGEGTFYTPNLQKMGPTVYYQEGTYGQAMTAFSDGKVLIALPGRFLIVNQQGKIVRGPTEYDDEQISGVSVTTLSGGKTAVIAYNREVGPRGSGRYVVVNNAGKIVAGPETFSSQGKTTYISATTLSNGLINLAYSCSGSKTKVIDVFNNTIVGEHKFHAKLIYGIESIVLDNDNILLAYIDQDSKGQCMVIKPSGSKVSGPHQIHSENVERIRLAKLANGNVCLVFTIEGRAGQCAIVDTSGKVIKGPVRLYDEYKLRYNDFDCVHLRDNMVMILLNANKSGSNNSSDKVCAYMVVK